MHMNMYEYALLSDRMSICELINSNYVMMTQQLGAPGSRHELFC